MNPARFYGSLCVRRQFKVSLEIQLLEDLPLPLSQLPVQLPGALSAAENLEQVPLGRMWAHRVGISALALALLRLLFKKIMESQPGLGGKDVKAHPIPGTLSTIPGHPIQPGTLPEIFPNPAHCSAGNSPL